MGYRNRLEQLFARAGLDIKTLEDLNGITGDQIAADAGIKGTQLADNADISGSQLASDADIAGSQLADDADIGGGQIASDAGILGSQLAAAAAIAGTQLADDTIDHEKIADGTITAEEISPGALTPDCLAAGVKKVLVGHITYNDGKSANPIIAIPANSLVTDVIAVCTETFNGSSVTLTIGDDGTADGFLSNAHISLTAGNVSGEDVANRGAYLWTAGQQDGLEAVTSWGRAKTKFYANSSYHVYSTLGYTGTSKGTTGAMTVYFIYVQLQSA